MREESKRRKVHEMLNTYDPEKKKRSDDIRDPDMIIATWRVVYHNFKIESQRLVFPLRKPSL